MLVIGVIEVAADIGTYRGLPCRSILDQLYIDLLMKEKSLPGTVIGTYRLVRHRYTYLSKREGWNPEEVTEDSWWVEGPGVFRKATVEEIDIYHGVLARVIDVIKPFDEFVNVTTAGGTPYEAIKKEFDL